ncbi:hypothetical protein ACS0TY_028480 [Phlomoides rotata]
MENSYIPTLAFILLFNLTTLTSSTDQLALLSVKNTITSDPRALLTTNWSTHTPVCNWIGVTCSLKNHRVTALNISHFDLGGTIAPHIGNLTFLRSLDLSFNHFTGTIPSGLSNLRRLEELHAGANTFSGGIPPSLFNITSLQILDMGYNFLNGDIPEEVGNLSSLQVFNLGYNNLTGSVPRGVFNVSSLVEIILRNNNLSNYIPRDICNNTPLLRIISFSGNQLSGEIPATIWKCIELEALFLSANHLNGSIPGGIGSLSKLSKLLLGLNDLEDGEIPNEGPFVNFTSESFVNNSALCGSSRFQVPPCMMNHETLRPRSKDAVRLVLYSVASLIAVVFWVMGIFLSITFVIIIWREKEARIPPHLVDTQPSLGVAWTVISYVQLLQVTHGFSETNLLGSGGIGSVYKGTLSNGLSIAVKVFNLELKGATESFVTETEILSSIRHRNLIRVFGCCVNAEFKALVLAYMPNGSLEKLLYSDTYYLNLVQRLNIAVDVALALEYLHHHHTFTVVHCDIKPSNVLLDQDMTSHLSDFGVAKLFGKAEAVVQTTTFLGTIGYAPPEYGFEGRVSTMGDVYSYGIMLLELFTRKKPTDNMFNGEISLKEWVVDAIERNVIHKVVDPALLSKQNQHFLPKEWLCEAIERNAATEVVDPALLSTQDQQFLLKVLRPIFYLAIKCLAYSPYDRMNMIEVAFNLQKIKNIVDSEMTRKSSPYYSIAASSPQASQTTDSQLLVSSEEQMSSSGGGGGGGGRAPPPPSEALHQHSFP